MEVPSQPVLHAWGGMMSELGKRMSTINQS